jgi:hypothetical protein
MNEQNVVYPYNGILAIERNEILSYTTMWINSENIKKISQSQEATYHMIPFI